MNNSPGKNANALQEAIHRVIHHGEDLSAPATREAMEVIGLVGPEGGFTPAELAAATAAGRWRFNINRTP